MCTALLAEHFTDRTEWNMDIKPESLSVQYACIILVLTQHKHSIYTTLLIKSSTQKISFASY